MSRHRSTERGWPLQSTCYLQPRKGRCSGHAAQTLRSVSAQRQALRCPTRSPPSGTRPSQAGPVHLPVRVRVGLTPRELTCARGPREAPLLTPAAPRATPHHVALLPLGRSGSRRPSLGHLAEACRSAPADLVASLGHTEPPVTLRIADELARRRRRRNDLVVLSGQCGPRAKPSRAAGPNGGSRRRGLPAQRSG